MAAAVTCPEPTCTGRVSDTSTCSSTSEAGLRLGGGGTTSDPQGTGPKRRRVHGAGHRAPRVLLLSARIHRRSPCRPSRSHDLPRRSGEGVGSPHQPRRRHFPGCCWLGQRPVRGDAPDATFLCHFERAVDICERGPYAEISRYLSIHRGPAGRAFDTLTYLCRFTTPTAARTRLWSIRTTITKVD